MIVQELFSKIPFAEVLSKPNMNVSGVAINSNLVEPGDLFIAMIGENQNGYRFIQHALQKGAAAVAGEEIRSKKNHMASIYLPNAAKHLPFICSTVYEHPTKKLELIGVTGTNGKTTTAHLIEAILREIKGDKVGYIGTTGYRWAGSHQESTLTTPFAPQLQRIFRKMVESSVESAVIECSSHGIDQHRVDYSHFDVAVFTNLTHDHLDYHRSFVEYKNTKWKLFSGLLLDSDKRKKHAVFNVDDATGRSWSRERLPLIDVLTYSSEINGKADVFPQKFTQHSDSMELSIRVGEKLLEFKAPMIGSFNLQNILAALSVIYALSFDLDVAANVISKGVFIPGRMEKIVDTGNISVFVDFAHSEDSISRVLDTLNGIKKGRIITVFGCGGESDTTKRPRMGRVAVEKSDIVVVTSDNPRNEDPEKIMDEIFTGIDQSQFSSKEIFRITKRDEAIQHALRMTKKDDIVLIAGKGHETHQQIGNIKQPFEDRKIVKAWMKQR
ncbi:MAG: UDP-N-acetylmuramoyl-L-alanyl-D-glutamate--2,6-diaminopimelate ligase [Bdellovibrionota bacterium]